MKPLISICIPTYNQTFYLKKVIDSILIQTFSNYEIIISDDSTTNDVRELIEQYKLLNPTIIIDYYHNSPGLGTPANWNNSISKSKGKWIKIMHHDDRFAHPESLQQFINLTNKNDNIEFVYSGSYYINSQKNKVNHSISLATYKRININPKSLFSGNLIGPPSAVMFKNTEILFDEKLKWLVDIEFYTRYIGNRKSTNYTADLLIESFIPDERVTNDCWMNKYVEIPEYLYCINKQKIKSLKIQLHTANLFYKLRVYSLSDIRECGYKYPVPITLLGLIFIIRLKNKIKNTINRL